MAAASTSRPPIQRTAHAAREEWPPRRNRRTSAVGQRAWHRRDHRSALHPETVDLLSARAPTVGEVVGWIGRLA
ncbi:hypothetical protein O7622_16715 [Micromonospora sp. WMMD1076]|uniref:hypothetical protein n=1 Tax=Micromonospora sp. WMMD1076 TaxID=3016103 RepID=UPI00249C30D6|nr:hypothetical protein [Micromonospora sp. WMMD1076]WFF04718.1 hypothetical protein O7622_16715 [Micromonospora sp. WMMD1076]